MAYSTIAAIAQDSALALRIAAAAAQELKTRPYPAWVSEYQWDLASAPGWAEAWESAVASGIQDPGSNPGVITDGMILAAVQPMGAD